MSRCAIVVKTRFVASRRERGRESIRHASSTNANVFVHASSSPPQVNLQMRGGVYQTLSMRSSSIRRRRCKRDAISLGDIDSFLLGGTTRQVSRDAFRPFVPTIYAEAPTSRPKRRPNNPPTPLQKLAAPSARFVCSSHSLHAVALSTAGVANRLAPRRPESARYQGPFDNRIIPRNVWRRFAPRSRGRTFAPEKILRKTQKSWPVFRA